MYILLIPLVFLIYYVVDKIEKYKVDKEYDKYTTEQKERLGIK
jgi:hypothetical protein